MRPLSSVEASVVDPSFDRAVRLLEDRINLEQLQSFAPQAMEGRLEILRQMLNSLGNPDTAYRTVHIAGTKGKGSTCILLESLLMASGYRVGRFTSPHLYSFTERLTVNTIPCSQGEFTSLFFTVHEQIAPEMMQSLTYFELLTLLAFVYFAQQGVDVALLETGLGGRLDSTNICQPDVSIITSISYDHTAQLGNTLYSIATEKSGIIKAGVPVITTVQHPEPLDVICKKAQSLSSPLYVLNEHFAVQQTEPHYVFRYESKRPKFPVDAQIEHIRLKMPGLHQTQNAAAAISAFFLMQTRNTEKQPPARHPDLQTETICTALRTASLPLRVEIFTPKATLPTFIFDGAHNRSSVQALLNTISDIYPDHRLFCIFGSSYGKDITGMLDEIARSSSHVFLTQSSSSGRSVPPQELREHFPRDQNEVTVSGDIQSAWQLCLRQAGCHDIVCITGSLYLAAELRSLFFQQFPPV